MRGLGENKVNFFALNDLAILFMTLIFMNGFETGGYQAALLEIGKTYQLDTGMQGVMASVELFATFIAPLIFGTLADRIGKKKVLVGFTALRAVSGLIITLASGAGLFAAGIFLLGFTTSIIQYVAIAGIADSYPQTSSHKIGWVTAMYALGALTAPMIVGAIFEAGASWKMFFLFDMAVSLILTILMMRTSFTPREKAVRQTETKETGRMHLFPILCLCAIMFIYVGVENGVGFFMNEFMRGIGDSHGYIALSLFWASMIPARIICGILAKHKRILLPLAVLGAAGMLTVFAGMQGGFLPYLTAVILGAFCGSVYPNVLTFAMEYAGAKTATVTAMITVATGIGGALISTCFGFLLEHLGIHTSFLVLAGFMACAILFVLPLERKKA
jgi:FHS family glucose/mannose:H+ symporter-like MFS transporter